MHAALAGRDVNLLMQQAGLVNVGRKRLCLTSRARTIGFAMHPYRATTAADIPRKRQQFFHRDGFARLVAASPGRFLQIHLTGSGYDAHKIFGFIAFQHNGLENGIDILMQDTEDPKGNTSPSAPTRRQRKERTIPRLTGWCWTCRTGKPCC